MANVNLIAPLLAGAGIGGITGAATSKKGERTSGAIRGAGLGTLVGGSTGALAGVAQGLKKPLQRGGDKRLVEKIKKLEEILKKKPDSPKTGLKVRYQNKKGRTLPREEATTPPGKISKSVLRRVAEKTHPIGGKPSKLPRELKKIVKEI